MSGKWKPEYPGQIEPVRCWWDRGEPEDGLVGFHTKADRDRFSRGKPGPFRRRLSPSGDTIKASETWAEIVTRLTTGDHHEPTSGVEAVVASNGDNRPFPNYAVMPDPTDEMLASPEFEAVWRVVKSWDINVPEAYAGYCGANGSHVAMILAALATPAASPTTLADGCCSAISPCQHQRTSPHTICDTCKAAASPSPAPAAVDDLVARLKAMVTETGRDWRTGEEFVHGARKQAVVDAIREAATALSTLAADKARIEAERDTLRRSHASAELALLDVVAERDALAGALGRVREAILDEVNGLAIQCTVWMPCPGVAPTETMVDFIAAAIRKETP